MKSTVKACCFAILVILLAISSLVYFILYANISYWAKRIRKFDDVRLSAYYGKQNVGPQEILRNEIDTRVEKELNRRLEAAALDKKIILFWTSADGRKTPIPSPDKKLCGDCDITHDRSTVDDNRTGAIIFYFDGVESSDMPTKRNPNHLYIYSTMESSATLQVHKYTLLTEEKLRVNATMTYRRDSDFPAPYGWAKSLLHLVGHNASIYHKIKSEKSKLAIAVISDCAVTEGAVVRMALIKQLKEAGLRIDTYGSCFSNRIDADVLKDSIRKYKFFFAYENSYHCKDYISEKFFDNALQHDAVPVVWGATKRDYEGCAPPGSFIYSEDFDSPQHLIQYLEFLDQNDTEYLKYFRWRTMDPEMMPQYGRETGFCAICRALHGINIDDRFNPRYIRTPIPLFTDGIAKRVLPSLRHYMYGDENPECLNPH